MLIWGQNCLEYFPFATYTIENITLPCIEGKVALTFSFCLLFGCIHQVFPVRTKSHNSEDAVQEHWAVVSV